MLIVSLIVLTPVTIAAWYCIINLFCRLAASMIRKKAKR